MNDTEQSKEMIIVIIMIVIIFGYNYYTLKQNTNTDNAVCTKYRIVGFGRYMMPQRHCIEWTQAKP